MLITITDSPTAMYFDKNYRSVREWRSARVETLSPDGTYEVQVQGPFVIPGRHTYHDTLEEAMQVAWLWVTE